LSNETNSNDISNQIPLPCIEKPAIRIDTGIKLPELDNYVASIAAILDPVEHGIPGLSPEDSKYHPIDLNPVALEILRKEYLKVDDITPVLDFTPADTPYDNVSLIYQVKKDLTMRELDEFLSSVMNKLRTVIALDLKKDVSQSISSISIYGSRKRAEQDVLGIIDDIIDFINKYPLDAPLEAMIEAEREKYGWDKDYILTDSIAMKLEDLIKHFRV